jgi:hypothetical protein
MTDADVPEVRSRAGIDAHDGKIVRAHGVYAAQDTSPYPNVERGPDGKVRRSYVIGVLFLDDKTRVELGIRPDEELTANHKTRVMITGRLQAPQPVVRCRAQQDPCAQAQQDPCAQLYDIQRVEPCVEP